PVFELPKGLHGRIVHQENSVLAVRCFQRVKQVEHLVRRKCGGGGGSYADFRAARCSQNAQRLAGAIAGKEGFLLLVTDAASKLTRNRSEERRVGKECRDRRSAEYEGEGEMDSERGRGR